MIHINSDKANHFAERILPSIVLWVVENYTLEELFSREVLETWAEDNGYVEDVFEQIIKYKNK